MPETPRTEEERAAFRTTAYVESLTGRKIIPLIGEVAAEGIWIAAKAFYSERERALLEALDQLERAGEQQAVVLRERLARALDEGVAPDPALTEALVAWNAARNSLRPEVRAALEATDA